MADAFKDSLTRRELICSEVVAPAAEAKHLGRLYSYNAVSEVS